MFIRDFFTVFFLTPYYDPNLVLQGHDLSKFQSTQHRGSSE